MESEFIALAAVDKEAEWLKTLILKIQLWSKPIAPIFICYDSATTLAKAYSQMYNGKSRHLGNLGAELDMESIMARGLEHMYLHFIPRMCLDLLKGQSLMKFSEFTLSKFNSKLNDIHQDDEFSFLLMCNRIARTTASQVIEGKEFSVLCTIEMDGYDDVDDGGDHDDCDFMRTDILLSEKIMGFITD
ncbi:hypothetical protein Tco_1183754 [Tanacetum coccineum]